MQKGWSIFFGVVLAATFALTAISPFVKWWLPVQVSSFGGDVDYLFYLILGMTGFFFVLTEAILVYVMWRYAYVPGHKSAYVETNHRLEIAWTAIPAVLLIYIAVTQINTWEKIKYQSRMPSPDILMQVTARQWEWRMRYHPDVTLASDQEPARRGWAESPQVDDVRVPNEVHCWKQSNVKLYLKTQDVLHSFFLPNLRLKQDALPGKTIPVWFQANDTNVSFAKDFDKTTGRWAEPAKAEQDWELACAELCGGGHYRMRGRLYVHPDKADFIAWLDYMKAKQGSRDEKPSVPAAMLDK